MLEKLEVTEEVKDEPVKVESYWPTNTGEMELWYSDAIGDRYVKYEDYLAAKLNPNGYALTKDDPAVYRMMQAILDITGDCEQTPTFSGWQIQAVQNSETGEYLKLELIATDNIHGIIAPRL